MFLNAGEPVWENQVWPGNSMPVEVEAAQPGDAASILHVHQEAYVWGYKNTSEPEFGASEEALKKFVNGEFATRKLDYWEGAVRRSSLGLYVARLANKEIVGFGEGMDDVEEPGVSTVSGMYVLPEFHRQGIGSALLAAVLADLQHQTVRLTVTSWAYAASFYQKRGFQPTGRPAPSPEPPRAYGIDLAQTEMELRRSRGKSGTIIK